MAQFILRSHHAGVSSSCTTMANLWVAQTPLHLISGFSLSPVRKNKALSLSLSLNWNTFVCFFSSSAVC
jgi:hypothetical protein